MDNDLKKFLSQYLSLSTDEMNDLTGRFKERVVTKNNYVLRRGEVCKDLVVVKKGCLRLFYTNDDIEVSVWFAFAGSSAIEMSSFISEEPSNYFLQAIEDSEVYYLPKSEIEKMYETHPKMYVLVKNFYEDVILHLLERFTALQTDSAEKRYLDLLLKPEYMAAIPQKYLASFIGVTPTSLSRIRKQIAQSHPGISDQN